LACQNNSHNRWRELSCADIWQDFDDLEAVTEQLISDNKQLKATLEDKETQVSFL
jgi:cytochrome c556